MSIAYDKLEKAIRQGILGALQDWDEIERERRQAALQASLEMQKTVLKEQLRDAERLRDMHKAVEDLALDEPEDDDALEQAMEVIYDEPGPDVTSPARGDDVFPDGGGVRERRRGVLGRILG